MENYQSTLEVPIITLKHLEQEFFFFFFFKKKGVHSTLIFTIYIT